MRLQEACYRVVKHYDILRTIFVESKGQLWQVSLSEMKPEYEIFNAQSNEIKSSIEKLCEDDLRRSRKLGSSFIRFMTIKHDSGSHKLVLRISHSQFDGYSWPKVLETLSAIYNNQPLLIAPKFAQYIDFCARQKNDSLKYWASRLTDSSFPNWSSTNTDQYRMQPRRQAECKRDNYNAY
ncbi:unnamed protein product [Clonostachys rosea f. rosea IK726]|uniref:Uncharacterized protein n=1 Tax=Clonostachys rosea f. rosea IK726 TaxID=1349383 RepID=A0ACA9UDG0_BIOOC|nr:unnamed protein product [Clonostachys rosea f. rosea IK726]